MNTLPDKIKELPLDFNNTAIIMIGVFAVYKTHTDAKYNRETEISFDKNSHFHLISRPVTANNTSICPA